ncbi:MAG TPA: DUF302 domain-containing protein [Gammaproteobacteria bacterium]|nr:DUF302 domain-containing protein [Gammaproteobacteria bacterium]
MLHRTTAVKAVFATLLAVGFLFGAQSFAANTFVQAESSHSFSSTVSHLKHAISSNGMMVMGHINQANVLKMTGLHLKGAESLLVGNPKVGKKFFSMSPSAGAVLPLRMYVWDEHGKTYVGYFKPSALLSDVNTQFAKPSQMMDKKFAMILKAATH